ncbi:MAG: tRNA guanosine(34) transglycosylase Tgt [Spirochaetaceae bacterium]|nr:MAG: tRNA guanosine(34) transglycosylase Tgt [Spirochaetaceae bacterium]
MISITERDSGTRARAGVLHLPHGDVATPVFMPVGTAATVKAVRQEDLEQLDFRLILSNTYHLYLRPGMEVIRAYGGLHRFCAWNRNILTDSGGFQLFSLATLRKISSEGVQFRSHIDGSLQRFTPEHVVDIQHEFGSDVQMALDVCTPHGISYRESEDAERITGEWAERARRRWLESGGKERSALFGIVQGNFFDDLRRRSAERICGLDFCGIALGGLSVGEPFAQFCDTLAYTAALLPQEKPRYLMGIGTPDYILEAVRNGIDMFDCVFPTRAARNGTAFTHEGRIQLKNSRHTGVDLPIENECGCPACRRYSRGYIRHLFKCGEILGPVLTTLHNLFFLKSFTDAVRQSIVEGRFGEFSRSYAQWYCTHGARTVAET